MSEQKKWQDRYESGCTPWDTGRPDSNLTNMVIERPVRACNALDIGCGTGTNARWLAQLGFTVTGVDISEIAIQKAMESASDLEVRCEFVTANFLNEEIRGAPFDFAFDRGCFHSFDSEEERSQFAENAARHLGKEGLWLSLAGSTDDPPRDTGPPRRSASDIVTAAEPWFEILSLTATFFESDRPKPPRAWRCLMRKRWKDKG